MRHFRQSEAGPSVCRRLATVFLASLLVDSFFPFFRFSSLSRFFSSRRVAFEHLNGSTTQTPPATEKVSGFFFGRSFRGTAILKDS